jgi:hypothetical protein
MEESSVVDSPCQALQIWGGWMTEGNCKLCLRDTLLVSSHLMPRALYDLCRVPGVDFRSNSDTKGVVSEERAHSWRGFGI